MDSFASCFISRPSSRRCVRSVAVEGDSRASVKRTCLCRLSNQYSVSYLTFAASLDYDYDPPQHGVFGCSYIQAREVEMLSYVAWDLGANGADAAAIGASRR